MLSLFASQRNSTAILLRACLPVAVSWNLRNTHILRDCRRSMSDDCHQQAEPVKPKAATLPSKGFFHVWNLISEQGDSLLEIVDKLGRDGPRLALTGMYDEKPSLVNMVDSTEFPTPTVSFLMTLDETQYYLSLSRYGVVTRAIKQGESEAQDRERFVHLIHGSYSMFESKQHRDCFLAGHQDGSLRLLRVHDKRFPDPRVLFLMHSKLVRSE